MELRTIPKIASLLLLFILTRHVTSFDLGLDALYDNKDIPETIREYIITFEKRVCEVIDTELKRQVTMLRARIDHRISSLLDATLADNIKSGFTNKATDDAMMKRVEHLEDDFILLRGHLEGNFTALTSDKRNLQDSEDIVETVHKDTSSASSTSSVSIQRLISDVELLKANKMDVKSTLADIGSQINTDRQSIQNLGMELHQIRKSENVPVVGLQEVKSQLSKMNSSFDGLYSDFGENSEDIQNMKQEIALLWNQENGTAIGLDEMRSTMQGIGLTVNRTLSDITETAEDLFGLETKMSQIIGLCNKTNVDVEEVKISLETIRSAINDTNVSVQENKEGLEGLNTKLMSVKERGNLTSSDVDALKMGLQSIPNDLDHSRNEDLVLKTELLQIQKNRTSTCLYLEEVKAVTDTLRSDVNETIYDVKEIRESIYLMDEKIVGMKNNVTVTMSSTKNLKRKFLVSAELIHKVQDDMNIMKENSTMTSLNAAEMQTRLIDFGETLNNVVVSSSGNSREISVMKSEVSFAMQNMTRITSNLTHHKLDIDWFKSEIIRITDKEITMAASVDKIDNELSLIGTRLNRTTSAVTTNTGTIKSIKSELPTIRSGLDKANSDLHINSNNITSVKSSLSSLSSQLNTAKSEIESLRKDVKFEVRQSGKNRTTTVKKGATLKFNTVLYNTGAGYSVTSGQFRAPVAGSYLFWANVLLYDRSTFCDLTLKKNGVKIAANAAVTSSYTRFDTISVTTVTELNVGDKMWFMKSAGNTTNRVLGYFFSGYGGVLIRAK